MAFGVRSAMLQARVHPEIKFASEKIFQRIGLTMTEAMELFLRQIILDEKLPFEVVALTDVRLVQLAEEYGRHLKKMEMGEKTAKRKRQLRTRSKRE